MAFGAKSVARLVELDERRVWEAFKRPEERPGSKGYPPEGGYEPTGKDLKCQYSYRFQVEGYNHNQELVAVSDWSNEVYIKPRSLENTHRDIEKHRKNKSNPRPEGTTEALGNDKSVNDSCQQHGITLYDATRHEARRGANLTRLLSTTVKGRDTTNRAHAPAVNDCQRPSR